MREKLNVLGCALLVVLVALACRKKTPKEIAEENAAASAAASAKQAEQAAHEAKWRKDCKMDGGLIFPVYDDDLRLNCHVRVKDAMNDPGSADFPNDDSVPIMTTDGCTRTFTSYVRGKNAFNATVKTTYECSYNPRTGLYSVKTM